MSDRVDMESKKIALLWTNPYSANRGVGALTYSILHLLEQISKEYHIGLEYYVIGTAQHKDKIVIGHNEVPVINIVNLSDPGIRGFLRKIYYRSQYKQYRTFDYVLDMGEGDSYSDIYGVQRFDRLNNTKRYFIKRRIKQLLLPQTIGPFNDPKIKAKAIKTIEQCNVVLARDKQSYEFLDNDTKQKNIAEIIDMAFFMPFEKKEFSKNFIHVGLNISSLLWHGGYTKNNQFGLNVDYQQLIRNIIDHFLALRNVKLHIVPHVVGNDYGVENDYAVSYHLAEEYANENLILAPLFLSPVLAKNYIAGLDFFAGARMHATIAAFSSGVPVYPMAYSRKFNGLFMDTLTYTHMGDMKMQGNEGILAGIKNAFKQRNELKQVIQERMSGVVAQRGELFKKYLVEFLEIKN